MQHEISRSGEGRMHLRERERSSTKTEEARQMAYKPSQRALSYKQLAIPDRIFCSRTVHLQRQKA